MITMKQRLTFWAIMLSYFIIGGCSWESKGVHLKIDGLLAWIGGLL